MIREFLRYSKSFFKHKLFRLIIYGFIAFIIFTFVKIKGVNAATINNAQAYVRMQTQNCTLNGSNDFDCIKGTSYKFTYTPNNTSNDYNLFPFIITTNENYILFKNMIITYEFENNFVVDSDHRSIMLNMGTGSYMTTSLNDGKQINQNWFRTTPINTIDSEDYRFLVYDNYNFKPYYCTYVDENDTTNVCGIILESPGMTQYSFSFVADIPLNTTIKSLNIYIGDYNFSSTYDANNMWSTTGTPPRKPNGFYAPYTSVTGQTNFNYYRVGYDNYRQHSNTHSSSVPPSSDSNQGLLWLLQGITYQTPTFNVPKTADELTYSSTSYTNNSYKYYFNNYSEDLKTQLNGTINQIDSEIDVQQDDDQFSGLMNNFINSETSSSFTNLFTSLFTYPLSKLNEAKTEPLFDNSPTNNKGTGGLNLAVCTGRNIIGGVPEDRIQIPTINGVKWDIPCLHYDVYSKLHNENNSFYPTSIDGHAIQSGRSTNFYSLYRIIIRGLLVYLFFINLIDIYKYVLDSDRKEIEVIDL